MEKYILALDQGTSSSRAIVFDGHGQAKAVSQKEFTQIFPKPGWVEHNPMEIWSSQASVIAEAITSIDINGLNIAAIGITNQRETTIVWDAETGTPVYNAIVWQDRRTSEYCDSLKRDGRTDLIRSKTGLIIDAYFSATKIEWILKNIPESRACIAGNMDAWMLYKMTGGRAHKTDASTASRTMLYNIERGEWDAEICGILGIDVAILPEIGDSTRIFGISDPDAFLGIRAPIGAMLCDQQAALLGQGCVKKGMLKTTYGTGCFMLMNTGECPVHSENGLVTTVAWQIEGTRTYALDGGVYDAGTAIQWLRDGLGIIKSAGECSDLALSVKDNGGVYFVPAFSGLGAPHHDPYARGMMIGLTRGTTRAHIVRAADEAMAYQVADLVKCMENDTDTPITLMRCDGGAVRDKFLMQFQSDMLDIPIEIPNCTEATARGSAFAAAVGLDLAKISDAENLFALKTRYTPAMPAAERERLQNAWRRAVERAKS